MQFPEKIRSIKSTDRVLEIGPGGAPHPRSDVLLEKTFNTEGEAARQRAYVDSLQTDKQLVYYEGGEFPFEDGAFDYVICSHVLEHIEENDVVEFVSELQRVSSKGYLEFPGINYEYLYNFKAHVLFLNYKNDVIYYKDKSETALDDFYEVQSFFYDTLAHGYDETIMENKECFFHGFEWFEQINLVKANSIKEFILDNFSLSRVPLKLQKKRTFVRWSKVLWFKLECYIQAILRVFGFVGIKRLLCAFKRYWKSLCAFSEFKATDGERFSVKVRELNISVDHENSRSVLDSNYVNVLRWLSDGINKLSPDKHLDISFENYLSRLMGSFLSIRYFDCSVGRMKPSLLSERHVDFSSLPFGDNSVESLSCTYVLDSLGLGRHGELIDIDGDLKAIFELKRVIKEKGYLLIVVPIGSPKVIFNLCRIYSYDQILSYFDNFNLLQFTLIVDDATQLGVVEEVKNEIDVRDYSPGCFLLQKK